MAGPSPKRAFCGAGPRGFGIVYEALAFGEEATKAVKVIGFGGRGVPCPLEAAVMEVHRPPPPGFGGSDRRARRQALHSDGGGRLRPGLQGAARKERPPGFGGLLRKWVWELASAVLCLHKEGIIHADIKPANVLVYGNDLKLGDMTLATRIRTSDGTLIRHRLRLGTPRYRAPEVRTKSRDGWSAPADAWSLGCTIYEMAYGKPFFATPRDRKKVEPELDALIGRWRAKRALGKTSRILPRGDLGCFNSLVSALLDCDQHSRLTAQEVSAPFPGGGAAAEVLRRQRRVPRRGRRRVLGRAPPVVPRRPGHRRERRKPLAPRWSTR